jgi:hypothetical protein
MEDRPTLIPTRYKSKLSSLLSWPIGAEEISASLAAVQQFGEIELTFYFRGVKDIATARTTAWMTLVEIHYRRRAGRMFDSYESISKGILDRHWAITVKPVLREKRKELHDGIMAQMPRVAEWFASRQSLSKIGNARLRIVWDAVKDEVYTSSEEEFEPERA